MEPIWQFTLVAGAWVIFAMGVVLVVAYRKIGRLERQLDDATSAWHLFNQDLRSLSTPEDESP